MNAKIQMSPEAIETQKRTQAAITTVLGSVSGLSLAEAKYVLDMARNEVECSKMEMAHKTAFISNDTFSSDKYLVSSEA